MKHYLLKLDAIHPKSPQLIYIEINQHRLENRKIEIYPDGTIGLASSTLNRENSVLGSSPFPSFDTLKRLPYIEISEINLETFEEIWSKNILKIINNESS